MTARKKNIFLTGAPSSGKTTLIKKVIQGLERRAHGFYTEEERSGGRRTGFVLNTLHGEKGYLAHETIRSPFSVRRYGVSVENVERIAVPAIKPREGAIIILDEIGKMECFSPVFRDAALEALDSPNTVVGTITLGGDDFIHGLRRRGDMEIIEVTPENRDALPGLILQRVRTLP